jgi:hypothetical protein
LDLPSLINVRVTITLSNWGNEEVSGSGVVTAVSPQWHGINVIINHPGELSRAIGRHSFTVLKTPKSPGL